MSTLFFWCMASTLIILGVLRIARSNRAPSTSSPLTDIYPAASTSDDVLGSFFLNPSNYANQPEAHVFQVVGRPRQRDDWDWGRLVYYWKGQSISVRVVIQGGTVICAELIDPARMERFAEAVEVLWERPGDHLASRLDGA